MSLSFYPLDLHSCAHFLEASTLSVRIQGVKSPYASRFHFERVNEPSEILPDARGTLAPFRTSPDQLFFYFKSCMRVIFAHVARGY